MQEVRAKKALGQHFLTDENIARRIAGALSGGGDVLEVGCGTGMLTQFLLERTDITLYGAEVKASAFCTAGFLISLPGFMTGISCGCPCGRCFPAG